MLLWTGLGVDSAGRGVHLVLEQTNPASQAFDRLSASHVIEYIIRQTICRGCQLAQRKRSQRSGDQLEVSSYPS